MISKTTMLVASNYPQCIYIAAVPFQLRGACLIQYTDNGTVALDDTYGMDFCTTGPLSTEYNARPVDAFYPNFDDFGTGFFGPWRWWREEDGKKNGGRRQDEEAEADEREEKENEGKEKEKEEGTSGRPE